MRKTLFNLIALLLMSCMIAGCEKGKASETGYSSVENSASVSEKTDEPFVAFEDIVGALFSIIYTANKPSTALDNYFHSIGFEEGNSYVIKPGRFFDVEGSYELYFWYGKNAKLDDAILKKVVDHADWENGIWNSSYGKKAKSSHACIIFYTYDCEAPDASVLFSQMSDAEDFLRQAREYDCKFSIIEGRMEVPSTKKDKASRIRLADTVKRNEIGQTIEFSGGIKVDKDGWYYIEVSFWE